MLLVTVVVLVMVALLILVIGIVAMMLLAVAIVEAALLLRMARHVGSESCRIRGQHGAAQEGFDLAASKVCFAVPGHRIFSLLLHKSHGPNLFMENAE